MSLAYITSAFDKSVLTPEVIGVEDHSFVFWYPVPLFQFVKPHLYAS